MTFELAVDWGAEVGGKVGSNVLEKQAFVLGEHFAAVCEEMIDNVEGWMTKQTMTLAVFHFSVDPQLRARSKRTPPAKKRAAPIQSTRRTLSQKLCSLEVESAVVGILRLG